MTHLDISGELATEIAASRANIARSLEESPERVYILRDVVEGIFPPGIEYAAATHPTGTERGAIVDVIAGLTIAIERELVK